MRIIVVCFTLLFFSPNLFAKNNGCVELEFKLNGKTVLNNNDIASAHILEDEFDRGWWKAILSMTLEGKVKFKDLTRRNIGKSVDIILDGKVIVSPKIMAEISQGEVQISRLTKDAAEKIRTCFFTSANDGTSF